MTDVTVNNINQDYDWNNSSHRVASYGLAGKLNNTSDDTTRDTAQTTKLFEADQLDKLSDLVCDYYDHFDTMITVKHREDVRELADCFWKYAKEDLYTNVEAETQAIVDDERRILEEELCSRITTLNSIAGTTRGCFAQTIIGKTLSENSLGIARLQAESNINARTLEAQTIAAAFDRSYSAYILADEADFNKYTNLLQVLRGSCSQEDVLDNINRDIRELGFTAHFTNTAGDSSDTAGTYENEYLDVLAGGTGAVGGIGGP